MNLKLSHRRVLLVPLAALALAGCGRKGPLELPPGAPPAPQAATRVDQDATSPTVVESGLPRLPNQTVQTPAAVKLDQAARNPQKPITTPPAPADGDKPFALDPLL